MELFQIELTGFKKFKDTSTLKARGKMLAVLGPNEAGKSSLLRALHLLDVIDPYEPHERSRGSSDKFPTVKATYLISPEDRLAVGLDIGIWYDVTKYANGERAWNIRPRPPDRDYSHRQKLVTLAKRLPKAATAFVDQADDSLLAVTTTLFAELFENEDELSAEEKQHLADLMSRWLAVTEAGAPPRIEEIYKALERAFKVEAAKSQFLSADEALWDLLPEFVLFGADDRNLRPSYAWSELVSAIPKALENLGKVAELDLPKLIAIATTNPNDAEFDTIMERANRILDQNFRSAWNQSKVSVVLAHREQSLLVQVYNNDGSRTDFAQRSDGLRQFVALRCFTASRETDNFILLIDEVEQHLHYDAQADLIQMLSGQTVASKVIYTTHSLGCLPEDLGNGVRLIIPTAPDSDWSKIENKFWLIRDKNEAAFSPILMGMGASTMAFFPTRNAVLVEGPSDTILLPTMFREALGQHSIGVQFVHGLSEDGHISLPLLNSTGTRVCYLLDNDEGGRELASHLIKRSVDRQRVFLLAASRKDAELEDFIDATLLAEAVSRLAKQHLGIEKLASASDLPRIGKWDAIVNACAGANVKPLDKVPVAYEILDLLDIDPSRRIIDQRHVVSFKSIAERVLAKVREPATNTD